MAKNEKKATKKKPEHELASIAELGKQVKQNLTDKEKEERIFTQKVTKIVNGKPEPVLGDDGKQLEVTRRFSVQQIKDLVELPDFAIYADVAAKVEKLANTKPTSKKDLYEGTKHKVNSATQSVVVPHVKTIFGNVAEIHGRYSSDAVVLTKDADFTKKCMDALVAAKLVNQKL